MALSKHLWPVPSAQTTIGLTVTLVFQILFRFTDKVKESVYFFTFLNFILWSAGTTKWQVLFFLLITSKSDLLVRIRWSVCISKYQKTFFSYSLGRILAYAYTTWLYEQMLISCIIPSGSPFPPIVTSLAFLFGLFPAFDYY